MSDAPIDGVDPLVPAIARRLKAAKKAIPGMTTRRLQKETGLALSTVQRYLNVTRIRDMKLTEVRRMAGALQVNFRELMADAESEVDGV